MRAKVSRNFKQLVTLFCYKDKMRDIHASSKVLHITSIWIKAWWQQFKTYFRQKIHFWKTQVSNLILHVKICRKNKENLGQSGCLVTVSKKSAFNWTPSITSIRWVVLRNQNWWKTSRRIFRMKNQKSRYLERTICNREPLVLRKKMIFR